MGTFTTDARSLRLDRLVAAAVAYRDGPGTGASSIQFRVVIRDAPPADEKLAAVLTAASLDPGSFVVGMATTRLRFDVDVLWPMGGQATPAGTAGDDAFAFLRTGERQVDRADLEWLCDRLVVEVGAPAMSIGSPGSWSGGAATSEPGPSGACEAVLDRVKGSLLPGAEASCAHAFPAVQGPLALALFMASPSAASTVPRHAGPLVASPGARERQ